MLMDKNKYSSDMKEKEKAKELIEKFRKATLGEIRTDAKKCALICVDEMLNVCDWKTKPYLIKVKQLLKQ